MKKSTIDIHDPTQTINRFDISLNELILACDGTPLNYETLDGQLERIFLKGPPAGYTCNQKGYRILVGLYDSLDRYYLGKFDLNHKDKTINCTRLTHYDRRIF